MKRNNILKLVLFILVIVGISYLAIFGFPNIVNSAKDIKTGLDISGGVSIVYQARTDENVDVTEDDLNKAVAVIRKRLEAKNMFDAYVRTDPSSSQIYIEVPADINDTSKDPLEAVEGLDKTAKVEFRDPDGNVLLSGTDIKSASYSEDSVDNSGLPSPHVVLEFSEEGKAKFSEATEKLVGKTIAIYLDENCLTEPTVQSKIDSNTAIITMGNQEEYSVRKANATEYAMLIDSGSLPFTLDVVNKEYIGPYVGQKALEVSIKAGIVVLILIAIIMNIVYRIPGAVASVALVAYTAIIIIIMSQTGISLTLPGIAGLILSIGMAVDANVIVFERLKEELKNKVGPAKAFEKCFKRSLPAIIDGNITTFIIAILLYIFGTGTIKGFGIVLAIGVLTSLFTACVVTKHLLKQLMPLANKSKFLFGLKKEVK